MNQERSHDRDKFLWHQGNNTIARTPNQVKQIRRSSANSQIIRSRRLLRFWWQRCGCSYFCRGLGWGAIVSVTAVLSGMAGGALTKIDAVERAIAQKIEVVPRSTKQLSLTRPLNVLLIETEADSDSIVNSIGGIGQTVLLLRLEPQLDYAQVINIPLDSSVAIPGYGRGIVRNADEFGGTKLLAQTVGQLLDMKVDRYVRATPEVFQQLMASGAITLDDCKLLANCSDTIEQIARQQTAVETIRQRLNISPYLTNFQETLLAARPNLDTNLTQQNLLAIAYFVRELEPKSIEVDLPSRYVPGKNLASRRSPQSNPIQIPHISSEAETRSKYSPHNSIAVQNTTNNPELGMRVVAYLRQQNFRDVYLVEHLPLKLDRTRIVVPSSQVATAKHIQQVLSFGNLEASDLQQRLTLQIGKDARYLPLNY